MHGLAKNAIVDVSTKQTALKPRMLFNWIYDLAQSNFISPVIVDRDPVIVATGTNALP